MTLSEDDIERILAAAETVEESLEVLARHQSTTREEYLEERATRDIVERRFVKLTEATLDIARTLVVNERGTAPDSNPGTMRALGVADIVTDETVDEMAQAARFRNVLAHTYGNAIDDDAVYDALQNLDRYRDFLTEVRTYLSETGGFDDD